MKAKHNRIHEMRYSFFYSNPLHKIKFIKFRFHSCRGDWWCCNHHRNTYTCESERWRKKSHEAASINGVFNSILFQEILRCYLLFSSFSLSLTRSVPFVCSAWDFFSFYIFFQAPSGLFFHMRENKNKNKFDEDWI